MGGKRGEEGKEEEAERRKKEGEKRRGRYERGGNYVKKTCLDIVNRALYSKTLLGGLVSSPV